jgi:hypothetical protein
MGSATNYFENIVLDCILGANRGTLTPSVVYISLFTTAPDDGGSGTEVTSTGTGYARVAVTNNGTNWPSAVSAVKSNGIKIQFPSATASWGTVTHFAIHDAATSGNMLLYGELVSPISPIAGNAPYFDIDSLNITAD